MAVVGHANEHDQQAMIDLRELVRPLVCRRLLSTSRDLIQAKRLTVAKTIVQNEAVAAQSEEKGKYWKARMSCFS